MPQLTARSLRTIASVAMMLALMLPTSARADQPDQSPVTITIDAPTDSASVKNGAAVDIGGWAIDRSGPGTGVDMVRVYLDGPLDGNGTLLGNATYGQARPDVGSALGNTDFANAGYDYAWTPSGLSAGQHTLYVYVHSTSSGWYQKTLAINVADVAPAAQSQPPSSASAPAASRNSSSNAAAGVSMGSGAPYGGGGGMGSLGPSGMNGSAPGMSGYGSSSGMPGLGGATALGYGFDNPYGSSPYGAGSPYASAYSPGYGAYGNPYASGSGNPYANGYGTPYAGYAASPYFGAAGSYVSAYTYPYAASTYTNPYAYTASYYGYPYTSTSSAYTVPATAATTSLTLTWTPLATAATYRIYQSLTSGTGFTLVQTAGQGASSVTVAGLTPGLTYYFGVAGVDAYGSETPIYASTTSTGATSAAYTVTVAPTTNSVVLTWTPNSTAASYRIYQTMTGSSTFNLVQTAGQGVGSATVSGLSVGYTYSFQVRAVDAYGTETAIYASAASSSGSTSAPTGLYVTGVTTTTASLVWTGATGATSYRVLMSIGGGSYTAAVLSQSGATSGVVSGLVPSTTYTFEVVAVDAYGNQSSPSTPVTIVTPAR